MKTFIMILSTSSLSQWDISILFNIINISDKIQKGNKIIIKISNKQKKYLKTRCIEVIEPISEDKTANQIILFAAKNLRDLSLLRSTQSSYK